MTQEQSQQCALGAEHQGSAFDAGGSNAIGKTPAVTQRRNPNNNISVWLREEFADAIFELTTSAQDQKLTKSYLIKVTQCPSVGQRQLPMNPVSKIHGKCAHV